MPQRIVPLVLRRAAFVPAVAAVVGIGCSSSSPQDPFSGSGDDASASSSGASSSGSGSGSGSSGGRDGAASSSGSSGGGDAAAGSSGSSGSSGGSGSSGSSSGDAGGAHDASSGSPDGATGTVPDGDAGACPVSGVDANTTAAFQLMNQTRAAMGSPCASLVPALDTSATKHCQYYAANASSSTCVADPHSEVSTCTDFVAASFATREKDAGYTGFANSEVMAFLDNGARAVQTWIDSVWHRTPILSPWVRDAGYGAATACDTMDFGIGATSPNGVVVTYPYDGQTGVPVSFDGSREGPTPPAPPGGWPSGYPITVFIKGASGTAITNHVLSVDGGAPIAHQWVTPQTPNAVLQDAVILYADSPLTSGTKYRVQVSGTGNGGAAVDVNITFTTK